MAGCCGNPADFAKPGWRDSKESLWILFLKICVSLTLASRGWLTWKSDSPIRGLIWQEDLWSNILENRLSIPWDEFARNSDPAITTCLAVIGWLLIASAFIPWIMKRFPGARWLLWISFFFLLLDSVARWVAKDCDLGMALEHWLQMICPIALFSAHSFPEQIRKWSLAATFATAFTFIGHGFYAVGIHPVPLNYQTMTMGLLGTDQGGTLLFLSIAGWLDIFAALALFLAPLRRPALLYCIAWGFLTSLARIASHLDFSISGWGFDPWLAETLVRTSHWMLPLLLLGLLRSGSRFP